MVAGLNLSMRRETFSRDGGPVERPARNTATLLTAHYRLQKLPKKVESSRLLGTRTFRGAFGVGVGAEGC